MFSDVTSLFCRKRMGKSFRKTLGLYTYKQGAHHKLPGIIPLHVR